MVPRWVPASETPVPPPPPPPENPPDSPPDSPTPPDAIPPGAPPPTQLHVVAPADLAPPRRFAGARGGLGRFASTGSTPDLKKGLGHYARSGLGGSASGTRRMAGTARTATALYGALHSLSSGTAVDAQLGIDPRRLAGRPAREVLDIIANAIQPINGTQDAEAGRAAMSAATADLLDLDPNVDLTKLGADQIDLVVERFVGHDLCQRIELDVGLNIQDKAPDYATAVRRLEEMRAYVIARVQAAFKQRRDRGERFEQGKVNALVTTVIRDTLQVFEEFLQ